MSSAVFLIENVLFLTCAVSLKVKQRSFSSVFYLLSKAWNRNVVVVFTIHHVRAN